MTEQKQPPRPNVPEIRKCPRCGANVLLGDKRCSHCGHNLTTVGDTLRATSPGFIALVGLILGAMLMLAATGMDGLLQLGFLVAGFGVVIGGGVYMAVNLLFTDPNRRRKKL